MSRFREPLTRQQLEARAIVSIPQAADYLGISDSVAYALAKKGVIPTFWLGARRLVAVDRLMELVEEAQAQ